MYVPHLAQAIGMSVFVFAVLPYIDVITGLMFASCLFVVPSLCLAMTSEDRARRIFYSIVLIVQSVALFAWPLVIGQLDHQLKEPNPLYRDDVYVCWLIPVSSILISLVYYENFIDDDHILNSKQPNSFWVKLVQIKKMAVCNKYRVHLFLSVWKCLLSLACLVIIQGTMAWYKQDRKSDAFSGMVKAMFSNLDATFQSHPINLVRENSNIQGEWAIIVDNHLSYLIFLITEKLSLDSSAWAPATIGLIQIGCAFVCHRVVVFACQICIQPIGFALPINLVLPFSVAVVNFLVEVHSSDVCKLTNYYYLFEYAFWNWHYNVFDYGQSKLFIAFSIIWMLTFVCQTLVSIHVWTSSKERLLDIDHLFSVPFYTSAFIDYSLMLNRSTDDEFVTLQKHTGSIERDSVKIYACATVWHETASELSAMIKSVMRMDQDQCERRLAALYFNAEETKIDYYEYESMNKFVVSPTA